MTLVTVTNTLQRPDGSPWTNGPCRVAIAGAGFRPGGVQIIDLHKFRSDPVTAVATTSVVPNNAGEIYVWNNPDGSQVPFQLLDSRGAGPFTLAQLAVTQTVAAGVIAATTDALVAAMASLAGTYVPLTTPVASYTYNSDGTVATAIEGGVLTAYAYNGDGTIHTSTRAGVTRTYSYNSDGTVSGVA